MASLGVYGRLFVRVTQEDAKAKEDALECFEDVVDRTYNPALSLGRDSLIDAGEKRRVDGY